MSVIVDKINRSGNLANKLCWEGSVVNKAYRGSELIYQRVLDENRYKCKYLTFEIISGGTINWEIKKIDGNKYRTIYYRKNGGEWQSITSNVQYQSPSISVQSGDILEFKGDNADYGGYEQEYSHFISSDVYFNVSGNIMSLINSNSFENLTTISNDDAFRGLFSACVRLIDASKLILPATTLSKGCYHSMFSNCYRLTTAPELPAKVLVNQCYYGMFDVCTSLNYVKCLATDISALLCTHSWIYSGVSPTGTFVKSASMNDWTVGDSGIPSGWTVIDAT